jgi:hypothetical protein
MQSTSAFQLKDAAGGGFRYTKYVVNLIKSTVLQILQRVVVFLAAYLVATTGGGVEKRAFCRRCRCDRWGGIVNIQ